MCVLLLLVERQHHGEPLPKGEILPREVKALAALVGPDRADARPDFLALLVFACGFAVVEDIGWSVRHGNAISNTAFSVGDWRRVSTCMLSFRHTNQLKRKSFLLSHNRCDVEPLLILLKQNFMGIKKTVLAKYAINTEVRHKRTRHGKCC